MVICMKQIKTKICSKCKEKKLIEDFCKYSRSKDGYSCWCKKCRAEYANNYKKASKEHLIEYRAIYYINNKEKINKRNTKNYINNKKRILKKHAEWSKNNKEKIFKQKTQYREHNKERIRLRSINYLRKPASYKTYAFKIELVENVSEGCNGELLVLCAYCGKKYAPTNTDVTSRIKAINGNSAGELRFYCSENCKQACPIYNQKEWPKGFKKATSREVVPLLRQLVLNRDDYTCQKCAATTETAQLHVHHILSYTLNKMVANDPDSCITFCKSCHKKVHQQDGCKYHELKCGGK